MSAAPPLDRLRERLLAAVLAAAEKRRNRAEPAPVPGLDWVTLVAFPDQGAAVALLDREGSSAEELRGRLDRVLDAHAHGLLFLVLVGGGPADREILLAADRQAPDRNKLGVYHLAADGRLERVAGRRSSLLADAGKRLRETVPLAPEAVQALGASVQRDQQEAVAFAATMNSRPQHATRLLGGACIVYFILSQLWGSQSFNLTLLLMGGNSAPLVREGEVWRLMSYAFLHGNFAHLAFNLLALISFGGLLEPLLGWRRFLLLYGLTAVAGGMASALLAGVVLSVGASGAVWGMMTAGLAVMSPRQRLVPHAVDLPAAAAADGGAGRECGVLAAAAGRAGHAGDRSLRPRGRRSGWLPADRDRAAHPRPPGIRTGGSGAGAHRRVGHAGPAGRLDRPGPASRAALAASRRYIVGERRHGQASVEVSDNPGSGDRR